MQHLKLGIGAPARLAHLRHKAERATQGAAVRAPDTPQQPAITWKDVRYTGFHNQAANTCTLTQSRDKASWYTRTGQFFGREYYIDEYEGNQYQHRGWFTDPFSSHVLRGLIVVLNGQRYLAGYEDSDNKARIYFNVVFDSIEEAMDYADDQARNDAEQQLEFAQADIEATKLDDRVHDLQQRLLELLALRHHPQFKYTRINAIGAIGTLRKLKADLAVVCETYGI